MTPADLAWLVTHVPAGVTFLIVAAVFLAPFLAADTVIRALLRLEDWRWRRAWHGDPANIGHWTCTRHGQQCRREV